MAIETLNINYSWKSDFIDFIRNLIIWLPKGKKTILKILKNIFGYDNRFIGRIKDIPMIINTDDWHGIFNIYVTNGIYEHDVLNLIKNNLNSGDVFIDVGANKGFITCFARKILGENGRIYAYEPVSENSQDLRDTVQINNWKNVNIIEAAITDKCGQVLFSKNGFNEGYSGWGHITSTDVIDTINVDAVTLDFEFKRNNLNTIQMVKIDIEGAEYSAIKGAHEYLSTKKIKLLLIEFHLNILGEKVTKSLLGDLCNYGYKPTYIGNSGKIFKKWIESFDSTTTLAGLLPGNRVHILFSLDT